MQGRQDQQDEETGGGLCWGVIKKYLEHHHDAEAGKEDSHMYKHWKTAHPEMETRPEFRIEVVSSYRDALSRQLGEAVRIELRGSGVLNSKAEYSRCRVPRLTINKEEWAIKPS